MSSNANVIRDVVKPTGTISGPITGRAGQPLTYNAVISDEPGGSGINPAATT